MEAQIHTMLEMEPEELEAWYREHNFKSQYDALYEAAEAIDCAKTLAEAQSIKEQYSEYFLYNDNPGDDELFNPYLPNENPEYAYVCNIRGEVEIDGSVVNFNTLNSVEETHEYQLTHAAETRAKVEQHDNYLKGITNRHKYWAEGRLDKNEVVSIIFLGGINIKLLTMFRFRDIVEHGKVFHLILYITLIAAIKDCGRENLNRIHVCL